MNSLYRASIIAATVFAAAGVQAACPTDTWVYSGTNIVNCNTGNVVVGTSGGSSSAKLLVRGVSGTNPVHVESQDSSGTYWPRFTIESNPGQRSVDINFRNSVINLGSWDSNVSLNVGMLFQAPDANGSVILVNKPGNGGGSPNGDEFAFLLTPRGTINSYVTGEAGTAMWVGRYSNRTIGAHFRITEMGDFVWGNPDSSQIDDVNLYRSGAQQLTTDVSFTSKVQVSTKRLTQQVSSGDPLIVSNPNAGQDVVLETASGDVRVSGFFQYQVVSSSPASGDCNEVGEHGRSVVQTVVGGGTGSTKLWICGDGGWVAK